MPGKTSAQKRRRRQRRLSAQLEELYGPDESVILHHFSDGWTVRSVERLEDQVREGLMMRHSASLVGEFGVAYPNVLSLRDAENLPRATFSVWSLQGREPPEDLVEECRETAVLTLAPRCVIQFPLAQPPRRPEYVERLLAFGASPIVDWAPPVSFEPDARVWAYLMHTNIDPAQAVAFYA